MLIFKYYISRCRVEFSCMECSHESVKITKPFKSTVPGNPLSCDNGVLFNENVSTLSYRRNYVQLTESIISTIERWKKSRNLFIKEVSLVARYKCKISIPNKVTVEMADMITIALDASFEYRFEYNVYQLYETKPMWMSKIKSPIVGRMENIL